MAAIARELRAVHAVTAETSTKAMTTEAMTTEAVTAAGIGRERDHHRKCRRQGGEDQRRACHFEASFSLTHSSIIAALRAESRQRGITIICSACRWDCSDNAVIRRSF